MANLSSLLLGSAAVAGALLSAGCSSDPQMTPSDAANFNGKSAQPLSDTQKKAMSDFRDNFNKLHPPTGGPGVPPPGAK